MPAADPSTADTAREGRDVGVVLAAAGSGSRFGGCKQLALLDGRPLLLHSLEVFAAVASIAEVVIVAPAGDLQRQKAASLGDWPFDLEVVAGGDRRQDSVLNGLRSLSSDLEVALVHDAARPLVTADEVRRVIEAVRITGGAVLGHPALDSVQEEGRAGERGLVERSHERERIWLVQTPQGARRASLIDAIESAARDGFEGTDETTILRRSELPVKLVEGSRENVKVTYPEDLALADFFLARRRRQSASRGKR